MENNSGKEYVSIFANNLTNDEDMYYLSRNNKLFVSMLADHCEYGRANVFAQNLLALIGEYPYFEYTPMPEDISNPRRIENKLSIEDMFKPTLNIYPNPTKGILTIEYNFETIQKEGMDLLM
ncbi:MAG: hypothetical protein U9N51_11795 [Bacteroidota bacterium]|nr:hypothetical protein [Bacteroidota bacterium]